MSKKNPLEGGHTAPASSGRLDQYCAELNQRNFVVASRRPYFIATRTKPNGETERYLDRKE